MNEWVGGWMGGYSIGPAGTVTVVWYQGYTRHAGNITAVVSGSAKTKRPGNCCTRAFGPLAVPAAENHQVCLCAEHYCISISTSISSTSEIDCCCAAVLLLRSDLQVFRVLL